MLNISFIETYISEMFFKGEYTNKYKRELFNNLNRFFNSTSVAYDDLSKQDILDIYSQLKIMKINVFQAHKSRIKKFMEWMYQTGNGSINPLKAFQTINFKDVNRSAFYETYYFENLDDLNDLMETVFGREICDFSTFRCAALLVWHGIPLKHLPQIQKKDLSEDGRITVPTAQKQIVLSPKIVPYLLEYRDAEVFYSGKFGGRAFSYKPTPYLFRTYKSDSMKVSQLTNIINNANKAAEGTGRVFQWKRIYDSGIYYRAYEYEKQKGAFGKTDYPLLKKIFEMDRIDLTNQRQTFSLCQKYREYQEFKKYKYGVSEGELS